MTSISTTGVDELMAICANCGKEEDGDNLKICVACKMVKYCNRDCQIAHRSKHKDACKKRAAEMHDEKLFAEPPPQEECPVCCLVLPLQPEQTEFQSCCGKLICTGCMIGMVDEEIKRGKKREEVGSCPFCRSRSSRGSNRDALEKIEKLIEKGNGRAHKVLAGCYVDGTYPRDMTKAIELYVKSGELGCVEAYEDLGTIYTLGRGGVTINKKKAQYYLELAAMKGNVGARHNLGYWEIQAGNHDRAMKHYMIAAKAGLDISLESLKDGFKMGYITKDEFADILRAHQKSTDEMKSDQRDKAALLTFLSGRET